jgi:hypothetical protein
MNSGYTKEASVPNGTKLSLLERYNILNRANVRAETSVAPTFA